MLRRTAAVTLSALALVAVAAAPASAAPELPKVPTNGCELADLLGFENVKECESGS